MEFYKMVYGNEEFSYSASGGGGGFYFSYYARKDKVGDAIDVMIDISESFPPEDGMVTFREKVVGFASYERVTGAALHYYNIVKHPVILENLFGSVPLYVFNIPNHEIRSQIEVLLNGIPLGEGNVLHLYKFRHVNQRQDYYRYYSYIFKFSTLSGSLLVAFPWLGALDSGGAHADLEFADDRITAVTNRGGIVQISSYDIEYAQMENFLSLHAIAITNHLNPELEVNQMRLPYFTAFGEDFEKEWVKFLNKFYNRDIRDAFGDIRQIVQDSMMITCVKKRITPPDESRRNPNTLVGALIASGVLDGRFTEWTSAFTAFSNVGGHSRVEPTDSELDDPVLRKRIVLVIMIGIQLIEELNKILKQL